MFTKKEINAIRFYQGDIRKRINNVRFSESENETGFYGNPHAYKTMNCLMFDGIENEKERIAEDRDSLKPQIFLEVEKVVEVYYEIFRAMYKSVSAEKNSNEIRRLYRVDRGISVQEMISSGKTCSFTSTSKVSCPKEYFLRKKKLILLEIVLLPDIPCLDFEEVFGDDYYFSDQREVLLPPFLRASFYEGKLTKAEEEYRDVDGQPPQGKYIVIVDRLHLPDQLMTIQEWDDAWKDLRWGSRKAASFLEKLIEGGEPTPQEIEDYCLWKKGFQKIILEGFQKTKSEWSESGDLLQYQRKCLTKDIKKKIKEFDICRKKYKKNMKICNCLLVTASVMPLLCMALSFVKEIEVGMRIVAMVASAGTLFLTRFLKVEAYALKLYQRSKTCLKLRDLRRQMKYEHNWSLEKLKEYTEMFRIIMNEDTGLSLQNLQTQIDYEEELFQNKMISM